ncbi:MAG: hypothetical protein KJ893_03910 [Candidatus Omnitrophica bacterium]|nr:hypothetical protein [Candidatus Omnitrophota bacterium]MBU4478463.1 hypothetical protein [Candidatus Omnitrophota bacterium]
MNEVSSTLKEKLGDVPDQFKALERLIARVSGLTAENFYNDLTGYIKKIVSDDQNAWDGLSLLAIFSSDKEPDDSKIAGLAVSAFFDIKDWCDGSNCYPVAHEETCNWINQRLLNADTIKHSYLKDAYGGDISGFEETFPEVKMPQLGGVKLRSMFKDSKCQYRYGSIESNSFIVGREYRKKFAGSLAWIKKEDNKGKTWGVVSGKELLFAYPSVLPATPAPIALMFGCSSQSEKDQETLFASCASDVIKSLQGISRSIKDIDINVFVLKKMDKARTKVVFHRNLTAERLIQVAEEWKRACDNVSLINIKEWGEQKGVAEIVGLRDVFPLDIAKSLNRVWKMDGTSASEVDAINSTAGIDLLIGNLDDAGVSHLMSIALQNCKGLMIALGAAKNKQEVLNAKGFRQYKRIVPTIFGVLLYKQNIYKEVYMKSIGRIIGNMLSIADQLHLLYCEKVRKGSMPPQLIGNSLMVAAMESPVNALAQLGLRLAPYLGWAATNNTDKAGLSRYYLKAYRDIVPQVGEIPQRFTDAEKAQVLLGYLAGIQKNEETEGGK